MMSDVQIAGRGPAHMAKMRAARAAKASARAEATPKAVAMISLDAAVKSLASIKKPAKGVPVPTGDMLVGMRHEPMDSVLSTAPQRKVTAIIADVTPEMARVMREECHYERQRNLSERNILRLACEMEAGRFVPGTPITLACFADGMKYLMNGNHTLEAIMLSGKPQKLTLINVHVDSADEAGRIYAVLDTQKARTWADSLRAMGRESEVQYAPRVVSALGPIMAGLVPGKIGTAQQQSRQARIDMMGEYAVAAEILFAGVSGSNKQKGLLLRAPVLGVALATAKYQPSSAVEFWGGMVADDGLKTGDPRKALLGFLRAVTGGASGGSRGMSDQILACKLAWNAWFKGKPLTAIRISAGAQGLAGTPFKADGLK